MEKPSKGIVRALKEAISMETLQAENVALRADLEAVAVALQSLESLSDWQGATDDDWLNSWNAAKEALSRPGVRTFLEKKDEG